MKTSEEVQELKWALALEADKDTLRASKDGRAIMAYLKRLDKRVIQISRIIDKIEQGR